MNRRLVGAAAAATLLAATLLLSGGRSGVVGSAHPALAGATAARCAGTHSTDQAALAGDMAGMPGMAGSSSHHPVQELRDKLARTPVGGTLTVHSGVYEGALVIERPVTLVGVGHPLLRGDGTGTVLTIRAAGTKVSGFMIEGSGPGPVDNPAGVSVEADHVVVKQLHIKDTYTGVWVQGVSDAQVIDNVIDGRDAVAVSGETPSMSGSMAGMVMSAGKGAKAGRGDGVSLFDAVRPVVSGNTMTNVRDGIYLEYGSGTRIECNSVAKSRYAIHSMYGKSVTVAANHFATNRSGPVMMYGGLVTLEDNVIRDHVSAATGFGVLLLDVGGVHMLRNVLVSNRVGLQIDGPMDDPRPTTVELNTIALNQVGVGLYPTAHAVLTQNSVVENTVQVLGLGPNGNGGASPWSHNGVGNYWSDYRGFDQSGRGVGQIPHVEGAAAGRLLAGDPTLLALATSPAFTLLRAVEQRSASQHPVTVDRFPIVDPRSPALPPTAVHAALGTALVGATSLLVCALVLLRCTRRRTFPKERTTP